MKNSNRKTLKITLVTTSDNTFDIEVYEPESGESRIIKCSDNGNMTEFNKEILSWVSIMREEAEEKEQEATYPELEGITLIVYLSNTDNKYHMLDISDRKQQDGYGNPWYEGAYGNCLIALNKQKITDKLYLYDAEAAKEVYPCLFTTAQYIMTDDERKAEFEKYATRIIERQEQ